MFQERLNKLFAKCKPNIQALITEVVMLEQANISMSKTQTKEKVDEIVSRLASKEIDNREKNRVETRTLL
ncbi:MAG TPA: hypothetical protein VK553_11045 [Candidatus Nitrosopolaris rasttigaisensis]|jgi:hypothetical protein|nr:hypothetical protein [Candidatus Nitrosopolaris rasttigaisensis]